MSTQENDQTKMFAAADTVAQIMKILSHPIRLMIVCSLAEQERSVNELVDLISIRQSTMSQHLATLKHADIVTFRKDKQQIFYAVTDEKLKAVIETLHSQYCA